MTTDITNEGILIQAPVGVAEVAQTLGEASLDVGTLCLSQKINPASLVRPAWSEVPNRLPEELAGDTNSLTNWKGRPASPQTVNGVAVTYIQASWQYYVPSIADPALIEKVKDLFWVHADPDGDSWLNLTHFDGYRHGAVPLDPVGAVVLERNRPPACSLFPGARQADAVSTDGANKGGSICLNSVLLGNRAMPYVYLGATVYLKQSNGYKFLMFLNGGQTTDSYADGAYGADKQELKVAWETMSNLQPGMTILIVPWAMMSTLPRTVPQGKGPWTPPASGVRFVPLNYNKDYRAHYEKKIAGPSAFLASWEWGTVTGNTREIILKFGNNTTGVPVWEEAPVEVTSITIRPATAGNQTFPQNPPVIVPKNAFGFGTSVSVVFPTSVTSFTGFFIYRVPGETTFYRVDFNDAKTGMTEPDQFDLTDPFLNP